MVRHRIVATIVALALAAGVSPLGAQQPQPQAATTGSIAGRATDEARRPYSNYIVQLRDTETAEVVSTVQLDGRGGFQFESLPLSRRFLVELYNVRDKEMVCTEGPIALAPSAPERLDLKIDCGASPAAWWLLAASVGAVAAIATMIESNSDSGGP